MRYIVHTVKGLEPIAKEELAALLPDSRIVDEQTKRLIVEYDGDVTEIMQLRTADDISVLVAANLDEIETVDWAHIREVITQYRPIDTDAFSVTVSKYKSPINVDELTHVVATFISETYGWHYEPKDHTNFDIRLIIEQDDELVAVRVGSESLFHRPYKQESYIGALRPSIAAAMAFEATQGKSDLKIVDTFCGSGTILAEAYIAGHEIYGNDLDTNAVNITHRVLSNLGYKYVEERVKQQNATKTTWPEGYFDCAISNLPWDSQISVESMTTLYQKTLQEWQRILKPGATIAVLLANPQLFIKYVKKTFGKDIPITTYTLGHLGQTPTLLVCRLG